MDKVERLAEALCDLYEAADVDQVVIDTDIRAAFFAAGLEVNKAGDLRAAFEWGLAYGMERDPSPEEFESAWRESGRADRPSALTEGEG